MRIWAAIISSGRATSSRRRAALLAAGATSEARRVISYLRAIQEADGHWPQNCWLDGTAYWNGVQMDECAFPILLVDLAWREGALARNGVAPDSGRWWRERRRSSSQNGPVTGQDRWEEDGGYSPFTLAVEIAALLAAADLADRLAAREQARLSPRDRRCLERV